MSLAGYINYYYGYNLMSGTMLIMNSCGKNIFVAKNITFVQIGWQINNYSAITCTPFNINV